MPNPDDKAFTKTPTGKDRSASQAEQEYKQEVRRRWRCFLLLIKAQLEGIELGLMDVDEAFFANIVVPSGDRLIDHVRPQLADAHRGARVIGLLE